MNPLAYAAVSLREHTLADRNLASVLRPWPEYDRMSAKECFLCKSGIMPDLQIWDVLSGHHATDAASCET